MKKYKFHYDAGHGWLEVPKKELEELGVIDKISYCSFVSDDKKTLFLEEDCDAGIFIDAYEKRFGLKISYEEIDDGDDSPIRELRRWE